MVDDLALKGALKANTEAWNIAISPHANWKTFLVVTCYVPTNGTSFLREASIISRLRSPPQVLLERSVRIMELKFGLAPQRLCIATSNKCLTSSNKKLLGTSASLLVTSALLVGTRS